MSSHITIMAEKLNDAGLSTSSRIGKQFQIGGSSTDSLIYFTPETARQWIETLTPLAALESEQ